MGGRVSHINLLNCVNSLPPLNQIYEEFAGSDIVELLTYVNNINDADAVNLGGGEEGVEV